MLWQTLRLTMLLIIINTVMLEKLAHNQHRDFGETFYEVDAESKFQNRQVFLQLLRNIRFFSSQGIPLRGHEEKDGNFHQLLEMQALTDQSVSDWLKKALTSTLQKMYKMKSSKSWHGKFFGK